MKTFKYFVTSLSVIGCLAAWAENNIKIENHSYVEKEIVTKTGQKSKQLVPATKVVPGDEVHYIISYKNVGGAPATDIVITNPIPAHMVYSSAEIESPVTGSETVVSVDGGKTYGALYALKVTEKPAKVRPALPTDVTHVQWKIAGKLAMNAMGRVHLRAVLK